MVAVKGSAASVFSTLLERSGGSWPGRDRGDPDAASARRRNRAGPIVTLPGRVRRSFDDIDTVERAMRLFLDALPQRLRFAQVAAGLGMTPEALRGAYERLRVNPREHLRMARFERFGRRSPGGTPCELFGRLGPLRLSARQPRRSRGIPQTLWMSSSGRLTLPRRHISMCVNPADASYSDFKDRCRVGPLQCSRPCGWNARRFEVVWNRPIDRDVAPFCAPVPGDAQAPGPTQLAALLYEVRRHRRRACS